MVEVSQLVHDRFALLKDLGMIKTPSLGTRQSTIYIDTYERNRCYRVDILHQNPEFKSAAFVTYVWKCNPEGDIIFENSEVQVPIIFGTDLTREEALENLFITTQQGVN